MPNALIGSAMMSRTRQRGLSEAWGSWKIMVRRRRIALVRSRGAVTSWPPIATRPRVGRYRPAISRATVDLPQPDSPTTARVTPLPIAKLTPSTAFRIFGLRPIARSPSGTGRRK